MKIIDEKELLAMITAKTLVNIESETSEFDQMFYFYFSDKSIVTITSSGGGSGSHMNIWKGKYEEK